MIEVGMKLPAVSMTATSGQGVDLSTLAGISVIYAFPRTSPPDGPPIEGWDLIPGARGCTPQACSYRDHHAEIKSAGADYLFGLSTQDTAYQTEVVERLHLPFPLLSDADLTFTQALSLPTFNAGGMTLIKRVTLIIENGVVLEMISEIPDPAKNAEDVLAWLKARCSGD